MSTSLCPVCQRAPIEAGQPATPPSAPARPAAALAGTSRGQLVAFVASMLIAVWLFAEYARWITVIGPAVRASADWLARRTNLPAADGSLMLALVATGVAVVFGYGIYNSRHAERHAREYRLLFPLCPGCGRPI